MDSKPKKEKNFEPRAEGEVRIFGFCNNKQKNKDGTGVYLLALQMEVSYSTWSVSKFLGVLIPRRS